MINYHIFVIRIWYYGKAKDNKVYQRLQLNLNI